jgi:cardiolipin synthase
MATIYRLEQVLAAMASERLWLTDAYFVGTAPYVQALSAAARDGVDVRLLVPGTSDVPIIGSIARAGYRVLLEAGVRVYEWNGTMLHAKTAVADGRIARVGSSNLNVSSWMGNREMDVVIEDERFAIRMQEQYERDLRGATEIVLDVRRVRRDAPKRHVRAGSSHAAAGALRLANTVTAAVTDRRALETSEGGVLVAGAFLLILLSFMAIAWPSIVAWPLALLGTWSAFALLARYFGVRRRG